MNRLILFPLLALGVLLGSLRADDDKKVLVHELSEWKFGETLFGAEVMPANLRGKVVVIEYWGARCPSCVEGISRLAALDGELRGKGLRVIGAEAHRSGKEQIGAVVESKKVKFSITDGVKGPVSIMGLPHAVVFGADGKLIFSGHPNDEEFQKTVKVAVAEVKDVPEEVVTLSAPASTEVKVKTLRTWKNHEGKPLLATLERIEGDKVIFRLKNGSEVPYEIKKLSKEDQLLIRSQ